MVTVRITELQSGENQVPLTWSVKVSIPGQGDSFTQLANPFVTDQEGLLRWYLERYAVEDPFEITKADLMSAAILSYGQTLSTQLCRCNAMPRNGRLDLEIEIGPKERLSETSPSLNQLHWEILEDISVWPKDCRFERVTVRRTLSVLDTNVTETVPASISKFNILLVVSRTRGRRDIDSQLVSRLIVGVCDRITKDANAGVQVVLKILRPPTWRSFQDHLNSEQGFYHVVHFDMHGEISSSGSDEARAVVKFCKLGTRDPVKTKSDPITGQQIAEVLNRSRVQCVIINACESANTAYGNTSSNLAEVLVRSGIPFVLAMAFQVMEEAVEIFMDTFYQSLLVKGVSIEEAVHLSRLALLHNPSRRAGFLRDVKLADYFVPICYQHATSSPTKYLINHKSWVDYLLDVPVQKKSPPRSESEVIGRDVNILEMELMLVNRKLILLHGQGGCGKTSLLKYCGWWWKASGWIEDEFYFDFETLRRQEYKLENLQRDICLKLGGSSQTEEGLIDLLLERRLLLVFDSLETLSAPGLWERAKFSEEEQDRLATFLKRASGGQSRIILSSRKGASPLPNLPLSRDKYCLSGLPTTAAMQLVESVAFGRHGVPLPDSIRRRESVGHLRRILTLLEGNPEAIELVFPAMKDGSTTPQQLLDTLLYGTLSLDETAHKSRFLRSVRAVNSEIEIFSQFQSTDFARQIRATYIHELGHEADPGDIFPSQFAPFWNIMPKEPEHYFFFLHSHHFQGLPYKFYLTDDFSNLVGLFKLETDYDAKFRWVCDKLLDAAILDEATAIYPDGTTSNDFYHVHPLFTLCARSQLLPQECLPRVKSSFVKAEVMTKDRSIDAIVWDEEKQHEDHLTNNKAVAFRFSIEENLAHEVGLHGCSMTDILMEDITGAFYGKRRETELMCPTLRRHLARINLLVLSRPDCVPELYETSSYTNAAYCIFQVSPDKSREFVQGALALAEQWRVNSSEPFPPFVEQSWFELRYAEGILAEMEESDQQHRSRATKIFERNLAEDPVMPTTDSMYQAIRRIQVQNLFKWISCAASRVVQDANLDDDEVHNRLEAFSKIFVGNFELGGIKQYLDGLAADPSNADFTFGELLKPILERINGVMPTTFGSLTKTILREPWWKNLIGIVEGFNAQEVISQLNSGPVGTPSQDLLSIIEHHLRYNGGDQEGSRNLLLPVLRRQTMAQSAGWQDLAESHWMLYGEAVAQKKWKNAIEHLDEIWKLHEGMDSAEHLSIHHARYALCYDQLGQVADVAKHILPAWEIAKETDDFKIQTKCLIMISKFSTLEAYSSVWAVLVKSDNISRIHKFKARKLYREAKKYVQKMDAWCEEPDDIPQELMDSINNLLSHNPLLQRDV